MGMKKLYITTLLALILIPSVSFGALSASELQAQISALLDQVKSLQAQLSTIQNTPSTFCYTFKVNLRFGNQNDDVTNLYRALIREGLFSQDEAFQDGRQVLNFDQMLASAVSAFQEKYKSEILTPVGLSQGNGFVGARTRAKLNTLYGDCVKPIITPIPPTEPSALTTPSPVPPPVIIPTPVVIIASTTVSVAIPGLGDVNLDGVVDSSDTVRVQQYIDGIKPIAGQSIANADVDGDKRIGRLDLRLIADYASCLISVFPLGSTTATRTCVPTTQ